MAGHVSSTDRLNKLDTYSGHWTLSGVFNSAMKRTNETCICGEPMIYRRTEYFTQI